MIAGVVRTPIARASSNDLMTMAVGEDAASMQVGVVLVLDRRLDTAAVRRALAERVRAVPRLRQRLVSTPWGCGRPVWVDDADFDIDNHVRAQRCAPPGDESALLDVAAAAVTDPLPKRRALWSGTLVTDLSADRCAFVLVVHHVLADGIGGLAALAQLVDGAPAAVDAAFPVPPPSRLDLCADAARSRLRALRALPAGARLVRDAIAELRLGQGTKAPRCSLNQPTGPRRQLAVSRADLAALRRVAHEHGATVNDVVLTAVGGALAAVLRERGEEVASFVVSVPVSGRAATSPTELGNHVGVMPVEVPATGHPLDRLARVSQSTRTHRQRRGRGASTALLGPAFRLLGALGVFRWFIDRQRLVTTFVTNVRGPATPLSFLGARVLDMSAVALITGNITVGFAALSYAGTLTVTVMADPDTCLDLPCIVAQLQDELDQLAEGGTSASGGTAAGRAVSGTFVSGESVQSGGR